MNKIKNFFRKRLKGKTLRDEHFRLINQSELSLRAMRSKV